MDTSQTYIDMSNHPKIQGEWKENTGDYYVYKGSINLACHEDFEFVSEFKKSCIWLPRQDQIQEMIQANYDHPSTMAVYFGVFCDNKEMYAGIYAKKGYGYIDKFDSLEQLWLAFYMYKKHKLIWSENKWTKK